MVGSRIVTKREVERDEQGPKADGTLMGLKELRISEDLMLHLCSGIYEVIASPLPSDARVVGRVFNELTKVWELGIESAAFDGPPFMLTTPVITTLARGDMLANDRVPGQYRCTQCEFALSRAFMRASDGAIGREPMSTINYCPNDESEMVPLTWKQCAEEYWSTIKDLMKRIEELESPVN